MAEQSFKLSDLAVGMQVRFKGRWPNEGPWWNSAGRMDHWLGQIVTIAGFRDGCFVIEGDDRGYGVWTWYPSIIAEIVCDEFEPETDDALLRMLGGG